MQTLYTVNTYDPCRCNQSSLRTVNKRWPQQITKAVSKDGQMMIKVLCAVLQIHPKFELPCSAFKVSSTELAADKVSLTVAVAPYTKGWA